MYKNILLSPPKENKSNAERGILSIDVQHGVMHIRLRTYNVKYSSGDNIGVYCDKNVYKSSLRSASGGVYAADISGDFAGKDVYFAIIQQNRVSLSGGTYNDTIIDASQIFITTAKEPEPEPEPTYEQVIEEDVQEYIMPKEEVVDNFYISVSKQYDDIFATFPAEKTLNDIIEDSSFVRVEDEYAGSIYILGKLYEQGDVKYLVYGAPAVYNAEPPQEMIGRCQWLPTDPNDPLSDGYYLMYQDAINGRVLSVSSAK